MDTDSTRRTFVAAGRYDSLNSCAANDYLLTQLVPADEGRITMRCYDGGHMMYEDRDARFALARDIRRFYRDAPRHPR